MEPYGPSFRTRRDAVGNIAKTQGSETDHHRQACELQLEQMYTIGVY